MATVYTCHTNYLCATLDKLYIPEFAWFPLHKLHFLALKNRETFLSFKSLPYSNNQKYQPFLTVTFSNMRPSRKREIKRLFQWMKKQPRRAGSITFAPTV